MAMAKFMNALIGLLLFSMCVCACTNVSSSTNSTNYTIPSTDGYCITFLDTNITVNVANPTINQTINLSYGQNYTNSTLNLTINAPSFPTINSSILLVPGQNYSLPAYNFSCQAPEFPAKTDIIAYNSNWSVTSVANLLNYNENRTLNNNETWALFGGRVTLRAPANGTCPVIDCRQNISASVACGNTWTNPATNITITPNCNRNIDTTLGYSQIFNDAVTNITVRAPSAPSTDCKYNLNESLTWGDSFTHSPTNITVNCQVGPNATTYYRNLTVNLTQGSTFFDNTTNITCNAPPPLNYAATLNYNDSWTNSVLNVTIKSPAYPKLNIIKTLDYGEMFSNLDLGLVLTAPLNLSMFACPKKNVATTLSYDQVWNDPDNNITITAPTAPSVARCQDLLLFGNDANTSAANCTLYVKGLQNSSLEFCADNLTSMCNVNDLKLGGNGVVSCVTGIIQGMNSSVTSCNTDLGKCQQTVTGYEQGSGYQKMLGDSLGLVLLIIGILGVVVSVVASRLHGKKKQEVHEILSKGARKEDNQ